MVFIRIKQIGGKPYLYLCKSIRNGEKINQKVLRYIGRVKTVEKMTNKTIKNIMERDGARCVICGRTDNLTIDHRIPIITNGNGFMMINGDNDESNLQIMCKTCNQKKGKK
jgi:5-methylcytosine-specific restriction endonuclease McrA